MRYHRVTRQDPTPKGKNILGYIDGATLGYLHGDSVLVAVYHAFNYT